MTSPVADLHNAISASPYRAAPEAAAKLDHLICKKSLSREFRNDPRLFATIRPSKDIIRLGIPILELLWSAAYLYLVTFQDYQYANMRGEAMFMVGGIPRSATAYVLYRELLKAHSTESPIEWPSREIAPVRFPQKGKDIYGANELFLIAISWIIHHEIAHACLVHQEVTTASILKENAAGKAAIKWVFEGTQEAQPLLKRSMGIVTALFLLLAYEIEVGPNHLKTDPPSFECLVFNLDAIGVDPNDTIYAFALVLVQIHLMQGGFPYECNQEETFREMLVSACSALRNKI
jgi:hypothetical protein